MSDSEYLQLSQVPLNVQKAVTFFTQVGLSRLLAALREKYIEVGHVGGQVLLRDSTANERREIASFLGKPPYRDATIRVRLVDMDNALQQSGFACTLLDVLSAFSPEQPLVTRQAHRAAHATHQADFRAALLSISAELSEESRGRRWLLHGLHGLEWLFSRYKNMSTQEQEQQLTLVRYIVDILDQLPGPASPERLALFAQRTSGDPHTLDSDRAAGRLFLLALNDLARDQEDGLGQEGVQDTHKTGTRFVGTRFVDTRSGTIPTIPQDRSQELRLYTNAGLLVDTISSSVAVFNLAGAMYQDGTSDPLVQAAGERVLLLPLRQLLEWQSVLPSQADVYVFENPQVFEEVISTLGPQKPLPTLVCTSGWPSMAALTLLDLLMAASPETRLYYSGDFDLKGLQIAASLLARYPGRCHPWRFDSNSYIFAMQADGANGVPVRASELNMLSTLPDVFASLVAVMQETGKWAYQEGIVHLLAEDLRNYILSR